jgi:hypothetical protein
LEEVAAKRAPAGLRGLFVVLVMMCELHWPQRLLETFADAMTADWQFKGMTKEAALGKLRRFIARRLEHAGVCSTHVLFTNVDLTVHEELAFVTPDDPVNFCSVGNLPSVEQLKGQLFHVGIAFL